MKRDMSLRSPELKPNKDPSPFSYPEKETKWVTLSNRPKVPQFTIKKAKGDHFLDQVVCLKKFVPGVGAHKNTSI